MRRFIVIVMLGWLLTACGGTSGNQQTLEAENAVQGTQFAHVVASATVERDRLEITVEFVNRELDRAEDRQLSIISTLEERGVPIVLPGISVATPTLRFTPTPAIDSSSIDVAVTPPNTVDVTPSATIEFVGLTDIIMSTGVENDCPINNTTQFTPNTPEIYITAVAQNLPAGTTIRSRWMHNNEELAVYSFVPDFAITGECIWFFVDSTDFEFVNGVYTVMLELNNTLVGEVTFTIVDA